MDREMLRAQWRDAKLNRVDLPADPYSQFADWLQQAEEAELPYPTGMSLATSSATAEVSSRIVLLRYFDQRGFVFFSGYETLKAAQMAENEQVALLFPWLLLERQVKILGRAEKISSQESLRFFATRSREGQIGAWLSQSSETISSRAILRAKLENVKRKFRDGQVPLPERWGGYRVVPRSIEFWQGHSNGLHDRFVYSLKNGKWEIKRLLP